jgi:hypothetical protein
MVSHPRDLLVRHLLDQLAMVQRHIVKSELNITAQRGRVASLEEAGRDAALSSSLLRTFEATLDLHYAHRRRVLRELNDPTQ